jgi:hypothetical protein
MSKIDFKLDIKTSFNAVDQTAILEMQKVFRDHVEKLETYIINAKEQAIREGLIKLGWKPPEDVWQPIETAPKDGTHIVVFTVNGVDDDDRPTMRIVRWKEAGKRNKEHWELSHYDAFGTLPADATHWMPLPAPPCL